MLKVKDKSGKCTVSELIEELKKYTSDAFVYRSDSESDMGMYDVCFAITNVFQSGDGVIID